MIKLITADKNKKSQNIKKILLKVLQIDSVKRSNLAIVIGGDGFMLQTLKKIRTLLTYFTVLIQEITVF